MAAGKNEKKEGKDKNPCMNVRCRVCRVVDGYSHEENECRFCGAKLFKGDVI